MIRQTRRKPRISAIIPAHNAEKYLAEAIKSIRGQTYAPSEIIVVDDGSTDTTSLVAQSFTSVRYLRQDNSGAATARNFGVKAATCDWVAFLDADDLWVPAKLSLQIAEFEKDSSLDIAFGQIEEFLSPELTYKESKMLRPRLGQLSGPSNITMLMRREAFLDTGGFPADLNLGEFIAWYDRAMDSNLKSLCIPQVLARRRLHKFNAGRSNRDHFNEFALIAKRALDRKRNRATDS
ncbi:glycosyltransferase family 2 protein [Verrucomicrobiales bacterium]|jgi:glycosyltransferase involved in cell wall biosynthesis|nr:glycosyltransferase family 2 protein [Verrucomicrobiales bacterium]